MRILHVTTFQSWESAKQSGLYSADALESSGFIHACLPEQLSGVLRQWFANQQDLLILEIETDLLEPRLVMENLEGSQEEFPNIYGPLNLNAVLNCRRLTLEDLEAK